ncbi:EAL domain-containing protein [Kosakonia sacchari]|uniref:EAL domain-containing protein n=1 Tax=Kosakonia sacchari TaxID=1158459 RepID=UPI0013629748|nr:EAL domain-containing protein [Kosakonia sacchari]QHM93925.1 sensor domain-containing phosphodiesterase [Kosakonia sacchari]
MTLIQKYHRLKDQWWALPLITPVILYPLFSLANTFTAVSGQTVILYYLPMALLIALMMFYGWAGLPGIVLALICHYWPAPPLEMVSKGVHLLLPVILSWAGYRIFVTRRYRVAYGTALLVSQRIFWQVLCPASIYLIILELGVWLNLYDRATSDGGALAWNVPMLINYQALLVGTMTGVPFSYLLIRVIRHPRYAMSWLSQMRHEFDRKVTRIEIGVWFAVVIGILLLLLMPLNKNSSIFSTNYTLSLLLPVMLWGSMRYGYRFMSLVWTPLLVISIHFFYRYLPWFPAYDVQLAIASSSYLVFSFIILAMAMMATRQRLVHDRARRLAFIDPVANMPNLRALSRAMADTPWSVLCFLRVPELELLGRNYGVLLRIQYKQRMADWLRPLLSAEENVYQLSGHDLAIRLNAQSHQTRIEELDARIKQFRFIWDDMPLQPQVGLSYCYVRSPVKHLYLLLGEMSTIADLSLATNHPENLQNRGAANLQRSLKSKVDMMNRLQLALEKNHFILMAQLIHGVRGDDYYEILLRMREENGDNISPDAFLPVAYEFGLSSRIDLWVIEHVLMFMAQNREKLPAQRFSINLSPASICRTQFAQEVRRLLRKYRIEAWQLIFEITESNSMTNLQQANQTLGQLQQMGCRVAIDDFGTGYASYARLKTVNADILKIDGSFIRNIVSNSLDYQIVASICHLARMKKMLVVAEYVESEEIRSAAIALGIDYLQGYLIGKPAPLETLVNE